MVCWMDGYTTNARARMHQRTAHYHHHSTRTSLWCQSRSTTPGRPGSHSALLRTHGRRGASRTDTAIRAHKSNKASQHNHGTQPRACAHTHTCTRTLPCVHTPTFLKFESPTKTTRREAKIVANVSVDNISGRSHGATHVVVVVVVVAVAVAVGLSKGPHTQSAAVLQLPSRLLPPTPTAPLVSPSPSLRFAQLQCPRDSWLRQESLHEGEDGADDALAVSRPPAAARVALAVTTNLNARLVWTRVLSTMVYSSSVLLFSFSVCV